MLICFCFGYLQRLESGEVPQGGRQPGEPSLSGAVLDDVTSDKESYRATSLTNDCSPSLSLKADIAPLMASLIGVPFPLNSVVSPTSRHRK